MKILAIDTSSKICSVAIVENKKTLVELHSDDEKTHSVKLMPMVDKAFKTVNLTLADIDLLACAVGPGSFTGIRIGIATIKAFADVKKIPVVGVTSLESLAYNLIDLEESLLNSSLVCPLIDARNYNVYAGFYTFFENNFLLTGELMANHLDVVIKNINDLIKDNPLIKNVIFVGDACNLYTDTLKSSIQNANVIFLDNKYSNANSASIATIALNEYKKGNYGDSSSLSPLYLRKSQAERALEEKEKTIK